MLEKYYCRNFKTKQPARRNFMYYQWRLYRWRTDDYIRDYLKFLKTQYEN